MNGIATFFRALLSVGFMGAALSAIVPQGKCRNAVAVSIGLVLLLVALNTISKIDWEEFSGRFSELAISQQKEMKVISVDNTNIISALIKENAETYILDKAKNMGAGILKVDVTLKTGIAQPYPVGVSIYGIFSRQQQMRLSAMLEEDLAIGPEAQRWIWTEEQ